jgi:2-dehydro-3-deoxyphosphooctonate aldolase (KDO 8-P synthase)
MKDIVVGSVHIGGQNPLVLIAGPCVIETEEACFDTAMALRDIAQESGMPFIFKTSYDKANRSSMDSYRGPGIARGLEVLRRIKQELTIPVLTDVHTVEEAGMAGQVVDMVQVPALLCRQTDLVQAAARTGKPVNLKKGQFLSPYDMPNIIAKIEACGNQQVLLTERGTFFGYGSLVNDMRAIPIMQKFGYPVCFDATHSVQQPGGMGHSSGGQREFVPVLARAAAAAGANAIFMEVHANPIKALSDGPCMLFLDDLPELISKLLIIDQTVHTHRRHRVW